MIFDKKNFLFKLFKYLLCTQSEISEKILIFKWDTTIEYQTATLNSS